MRHHSDEAGNSTTVPIVTSSGYE